MKQAMTSRRGDTQQRLLSSLKGQAEGLGVDALAEELGITVTAVRQHLVALERDGLVEKRSLAPSRGRPAHVFSLTAKSKETFPRQYPWFSELLLKSLRDAIGEAALKKKLRALGAEAAGPTSSAPMEHRVQALAAKMSELGYEASVNGEDNPTITARNCVFHQLAERNPEVCSFDLGLIERAAGAKVSHEECIVRGGGVCRFALRRK
jgi:predicted ArsR family transcriptional regulator